MVESRNAQLVTPPTRVGVELAKSVVCQTSSSTQSAGQVQPPTHDGGMYQ